jgi:hypothetical protein
LGVTHVRPVRASRERCEASAAQRVREATGSSMEGTSGAARFRPLRGGLERAALSGAVPRKRDRQRIARSGPSPGLGSRGETVERCLPRWGRRAMSSSLPAGMPVEKSPIDVRDGLMTRGVRADRVGVERHSGRARKLSLRDSGPLERGERSARSSQGGTPLACEHSAGDQTGARARLRLGACDGGPARTGRRSRRRRSAKARALEGALAERRESNGQRGGARGLYWLQKSTSGARSTVARPWV